MILILLLLLFPSIGNNSPLYALAHCWAYRLEDFAHEASGKFQGRRAWLVMEILFHDGGNTLFMVLRIRSQQTLSSRTFSFPAF